MDSFRRFICSSTVGLILCIGGSLDGVSRCTSEFQADLSYALWSQQWHDWFCRFRLGDELIAPLYDGQLVHLQSLADLLAIETAENDCSVDSRGGILLNIHGGFWGDLSSILSPVPLARQKGNITGALPRDPKSYPDSDNFYGSFIVKSSIQVIPLIPIER